MQYATLLQDLRHQGTFLKSVEHTKHVIQNMDISLLNVAQSAIGMNHMQTFGNSFGDLYL